MAVNAAQPRPARFETQFAHLLLVDGPLIDRDTLVSSMSRVSQIAGVLFRGVFEYCSTAVPSPPNTEEAIDGHSISTISILIPRLCTQRPRNLDPSCRRWPSFIRLNLGVPRSDVLTTS
jgi:hypothetical protein